MKLWSDKYRNGSFPCDVLNFHHYTNTLGMQHAKSKAYGVSPESDHLKERLQEVVEWRNENLPDKEVWLSEFGWDTNEGTFVSAVGHSGYPEQIDCFELQAMWLVRGYLAGLAAGVDRMMMFLANDFAGEGVYASCGFFDLNGEFKPSWYYVNTFRNALTGMVFYQEEESRNNAVWIYSFKNEERGDGAYVLWCPTSDGTTVPDYELNVSETNKDIVKISLIDKEDLGIKDILKTENGKVKIDVSEKPVIVLVNKIEI